MSYVRGKHIPYDVVSINAVLNTVWQGLHCMTHEEFDTRVAWPGDHAYSSEEGEASSTKVTTSNQEEAKNDEDKEAKDDKEEEDDDSDESDDNVSWAAEDHNQSFILNFSCLFEFRFKLFVLVPSLDLNP